MNRDYGNANYTGLPVENRLVGYAGLNLFRTINGEKSHVVRILYWDASGQFFIETLHTDIPLEIAMELITEAKATVRTG